MKGIIVECEWLVERESCFMKSIIIEDAKIELFLDPYYGNFSVRTHEKSAQETASTNINGKILGEIEIPDELISLALNFLKVSIEFGQIEKKFHQETESFKKLLKE